MFLVTSSRGASNQTTFLFGLVVLLTLSSWWHLDMSGNFYQGPRWMGLWDNPNIYGMLMGAGVVLTTGLLVVRRWKMAFKNEKRKAEMAFLLIAVGMMGVGLVSSYSRGGMVWDDYRIALFGKGPWQIQMAVCVVGRGVRGFGRIVFLAWHIG